MSSAASLSSPAPPRQDVWRHRYALLTAAATLALVGIGGVVTSRGVGMSVPDWPTTYGYNMFFFPFSKWVGGIFYEHSHRLVASFVGLLVVGLTRWLGGRSARLPLALIGLAEIVGGLALLQIGPDWRGAGHFLAGIGGVVLLGAAVWARNEPAARPLPLLGWLAFWLVQIQGLLGGLRVVLYQDQVGILHAALAQLFFVLVCAIALLTSSWWQTAGLWREKQTSDAQPSTINHSLSTTRWFLLGTTLLIFCQLLLGATMRHQHAGLAIPDFPLAYGKVWPAMDPDSVTRYNQHRLEVTAVNPITAAQIALQMAHRLMAVFILAAVASCVWRLRRQLAPNKLMGKLALGWLGLILLQALLGAATVWSDKAADIATAHVLVGALSLALGTILCIIGFRESAEVSSMAEGPSGSVAVRTTPWQTRTATATGIE